MDCKNLRDDPAESPEIIQTQPLRVLAAVTDLFFVSKISAAARQAGCPIEYFRDSEKLKQAAAGQPCLVIVDLNATGLDPVALIAHLKATAETRQTQVIAYLSHVQHELKREAEKAGADLVLPRSVLSQNLLEILRQRSCHL
ncbi:MAG: response regulator transcription factor [Acidobacteria bacterium]|nr:response regulator transcription factor [Acidobacteriota bacterium]